MLFVIVEYPDTTVGSRFQHSRPDATYDVITEPAKGPPNDRRHPCLALVQGLAPEDLKTLVTGLKHMHEDVQTLQQDLRAGRWMGRFEVRERAILGTASHRILAFQARFGAPWAHTEGGVIHLRARVKDPAHGDELAEDMRKALAADGIEAQVEVRELSSRDYGTWEELVQRSIGLG